MDVTKVLIKIREISNNLGDLNIIPQRIETFLKEFKEELKITNNENESDYYNFLDFLIQLLEVSKKNNYNLPQNGSSEFEKLIPKKSEGFEFRNYIYIGLVLNANIYYTNQNDGFF